MTTINCAENCRYQKDGVCTYELVANHIVSNHPTCIYFHNNDENSSN